MVTSTWVDNANGQTVPVFDGPTQVGTITWPNNNNWSQQLVIDTHTFNVPVILEPSNWTTDFYPDNGNGGVDYDVVVGLPTPTDLDIPVRINTLIVRAGARLNMLPGTALDISAGSLLNDGAIFVNSQTGAGQAVLTASANMSLTGTGQVVLSRAGEGAQLDSTTSAVITQGPSHTLCGQGEIKAALVNNGIIRANVAGQSLCLKGQEKTNNGMLVASNSGILEISGTSVVQGPAGQIRAEGGTVALRGPVTVLGGTLSTGSNGVIVSASGGSVLDSVTNLGTFHVVPTSLSVVMGQSFVNNGTVVVNPLAAAGYTILCFQGDVNLTGTGQIVLSDYNVNAQLNTGTGSTLTQAAGHTIRGRGQINAALINNGTILADAPNDPLDLQTEAKVNNSIIKATNRGILQISGATITQSSGGRIMADGGPVRLLGNATISGGALSTGGSSEITSKSGVNTLRDVTNQGTFNVYPSSTAVIAGSSLVNTGTITVNNPPGSSAAILSFNDNVTVSGSGRIVLNYRNASAQINTGTGFTVTQASGHTIRGKGRINAAFINNGIVQADIRNEQLQINSPSFTNNGTVAAINGGIVKLVGGTFTNTGIINIAAESSLDCAVSLTNAGTLSSANIVTVPSVLNSGTFTQAAGTLAVSGTFTNSGGVASIAGTQNWQAGSSLLATGGIVNLNTDAGTSSAFNLNVTASQGGIVNFNATQHIASLTLTGGGANLPSGGARTLDTRGLNIVSPGRLDLAGNSLIVQSNATDKAGTYAQVCEWLESGRNGGSWGGWGIGSSLAAGNPLTGLAAVLNDRGNGAPILTTFGGQSVGANDILVKYTWNGDTDLNEIIDADDYQRIDFGYIRGAGGYRSGDFDYNGIIDVDDYFLIDRAFLGQSGSPPYRAPLALGLPLPALAVPEPTVLGLLPLALLVLPRRRRRSGRNGPCPDAQL